MNGIVEKISLEHEELAEALQKCLYNFKYEKILALVKRVYDINLNSLGVNPPLTPPRRGSQSSGVRREERRRNPE
ncbi:hypothetical protein [Okeania sp. SIO2B3]|uniref:hypothetical protein n=1 Tax=Okeania sp. SIO2B3 TaxID=2607784 RepID=UPI0013BECD35|nr:hypothetical protein [Okeania sp. SIO2B3]NET42805.1 hypothetical protein [Okeania sp. SIO2B3]